MFDTTHLHPMLVHFPIALITIGFIADLVSLFFKSEKCLSKTGLYLMILGTLAAVVAWSSGHIFTSEPSQGSIVEVFIKHETAALVTMLLMIIGSLMRIWLIVTKKEETRLKWIVLGLYFLGCLSVTYTGFMGGNMVYNYMMSL
jgi:uncharacterized membrane protein